MLFQLLRVREKGWVMPNWRTCMHRPRPGDLLILDRHDEILNRSTRLASLHDPHTGTVMADVPPLFDATLVCVRRDYMTLTGFERFHDPILNRDFDYAQTWWLTPVEVASG